MGKHAFLILAHANMQNLINCVKSIDDCRNDIFIHIDKKWKDFDFNKLKQIVKYSKLFYTKQRIPVYWGGVSIITASLIALESASKQNNYDYYHLLSGQDICIKSQDYLHNFFDTNKGKEFIQISDEEEWYKKGSYKLKYYHLQTKNSFFLKCVNKVSKGIQKLFGVNRLKNLNIEIKGGSNWASITDEFCNYLIQNKKTILKICGYGYCADEFFFQIMAYNSKFRDALYCINAKSYCEISNMRYIDMKRGFPYLFKEEDFDAIMESDSIFVRKVTCDNNLPQMILDKLGIK